MVSAFGAELAKAQSPVTPTIRFTRQLKRLVSFLNLRKNMNKSLLAVPNLAGSSNYSGFRCRG